MNYAPYAPPQQPQGPYGGSYAQYVYQPLGWKTTAAIVGVAGSVVLAFAQTGATLAFPDILKHPAPENLPTIAALGLLGIATSLVALATKVIFLMWMHQAAKNVRAFGQQGLEFTPGWCVGWWFIPIMSLWKPFAAMREIWKASDPDTVGQRAAIDWRTAPVPTTMVLWWLVYIVNGFVATGIVLSTLDLSGKHAAVTVGTAQFITHAFLGVAGVFLIMIMRQLAKRQEAAWERLSSAPANPAGGPSDQANPYAAAGANPYT